MKKLNKTQVVYKFRNEILVHEDNSNLDDDGKVMLWELFLYQLSKAKFITTFNAKTWIYPKNIKKFK